MVKAVDLAAIRREYGATALDESQLDPNPLNQAQCWLNQAIAVESHDPTAMVLSTVDETGIPDARVLLLKAIQSNGFVFYTHYESAKGKQLEIHPVAAMTFFWPTLVRQLRIRGRVELLDEHQSDAYFASRPYLSQVSAAVSPQSQPIANRTVLESLVEAFKTHHPQGSVSRPSVWGGYILLPESIEFWQGRDNRLHDRLVYSLKMKEWALQRLAP